jgi:hypothetical protein
LRDGPDDAVQCTGPQRAVVWNCDPVMHRSIGFENDVTANLVDESITEGSPKGLNEISA